ncbi:skin secretory protein xP2-like [Hippopotamus amphibius kiboko]|uniref:skin secretory protein xP2-like n=1 Tax=Hippopotamus amphibius kiboko TaxID=575201 RepID=UPI002599DBB9|nr:skin secretory protein xP2-like [Hippopotamus amphibius kiboko]
MLARVRAPRALQLPCADLNPPSRAPAPAETANQDGAARRQAPGKTRADGRAPEPDWRGWDAFGSARRPAAQAEGKPGLTHPRAAGSPPGPGPRMWGAGTGPPPPTACQPEPRPGSGLQPSPARRDAARLRRPSPLPPALCAAAARARQLGPGPVPARGAADAPRGRAARPAPPPPPPPLSRPRQHVSAPKRRVPSITSLILAASSQPSRGSKFRNLQGAGK